MWFSNLSAGDLLTRFRRPKYPDTLRRGMRTSDVDLYFSIDVETDGPIPGEYSLLSFAIVIVGSFDGKAFTRAEGEQSMYRELRPISDKYQAEALAVNGLDRERLMAEGEDPRTAMNDAHSWVISHSRGFQPVFVGYPAVFDWSWMFWYFMKYADDGSPFGFSSCLDLKSMLATKAGLPLSLSKRSLLPAELVPDFPHTHNALDDAIEQGQFLARLFDWTP